MDMTTRDLSPAEYRALQRRAIEAQMQECREVQKQTRPATSVWWRAEGRWCECQAQLAELDEAEAAEREAKDWHGGDPSEWPADLRVRQFPETK